jgi:translation initiation factor 3 subunit B
VKVDRTSKSKKSAYTDFEIFRLREKDIPIEHFEIKEGVSTLAFEPKGTKFAVIHGEGPKPSVSFYNVEGKLQHISNPLPLNNILINILETLEKKSCNALYWSPQGGFIVLAGLGAMNGVFEFYNAIDMDTVVTEEHFMATQVEWDPTGRFFSTVVSGWKHQVLFVYTMYKEINMRYSLRMVIIFIISKEKY